MTNIPALDRATRGVTSTGVPFLALPPEEGYTAAGLVVLWHGADPPRTEEALAAAVPLRGLPAWRVYLGMPLYSSRTAAGGFEEIMRRGAEDAVTLVYGPVIEGAVAELPGALDEIRSRLEFDPALPLGIFGFSQGGAAALLAVSRRVLPFKAVATWGAVTDLVALVDTLSAFFKMTYTWTPERLALAERMSVVHQARALAESRAAILLGLGADDQYPVREPTERLAAAIQSAGGLAEINTVPNVGHAFVDEPGVVASPQSPQAKAIDVLVEAWFRRHLR